MALTVAVRRASNLPNVDKTSKSDPYAVVSFRGQERKTRFVKDCLDPQWKEVFKFALGVPSHLKPEDLLEVRVYDHEYIGKNRLLGLVKIYVSEYEVASGREWTTESSYPLRDEQDGITEATIYVFLSYEPPLDQTEQYASQDTMEHPEETGKVDTYAAAPLKRHKEGALSRSTHESTFGTGKARMKFPDRQLDFQVLVHIFEARRLMGNNLKPMVKVTCGSVVQSTGVRRGTEKPYWNETLAFTLKEKAQRLFEQQLKIEVLDAQSIFAKHVLGQFMLDIGWVFDEPEHSIANKWLLLTASDEALMSVKGYLKVSVTVVPPGGTAKPFKPLASSGSDSIDNEANLLRPLGARLQPATLSVTVYHAEDLPQMDPEMFERLKSILPGVEKTPKHNLVDPYVTVSFAGHSQHTSTVHENRDPVWDTKLNLGVRFPSMCNTIQIQLLDHDTVSDDIIGTAFLEIPQISVFSDSSLGFPPTFGPTFVNVYGSQREFSILPSKYKLMDKGKAKGVAYRGRILLNVDMTLGSSPAVPREILGVPDKKRSMPYRKRRTYKLYATFLNATMISVDDGPVEFEVSIGNYGNKLDTTTPDILSTTPSLYPVHGGSSYHYLPWFDCKPSVVVDSHWEDNTYRIASLNILINIQRELKANLSRCRSIFEQSDHNEADLRVQVKEALASFSASLKAPLPTLPEQNLSKHNLNKLDVQLRKWREVTMEELLSHVNELQQAKRQKPAMLLDDVEDVLQQFSQMIFEPQISVPDVIIWMMSGDKRLASARLPAHRLMYIRQGQWKGCLPAQGDLCGEAQDIMLTSPSLHPSDDPNELDARAKLHMVLWLGLASDAKHSNVWATDVISVQPAMYAETYENQANVHGSWGTEGLSLHKFSDSQGKLSLPRTDFMLPVGWTWDGEWFVRISEGTDISGTLQEVVLVEHQTRDPDAGFKAADQHWTDKKGEEVKISSKEEMEAPKDWEWSEEWEVEDAGVEDKDGWQYAVEKEGKLWSSNMRTTHLYRKRTLVRKMVKQRDDKQQLSIRTSENPGKDEGWEYAQKPHLSYRPEPGKLCTARRRHWLRKLQPEPKQAEVSLERPTFQFASKKSGFARSVTRHAVHPSMYVMYSEDSAHQYQLRAYLYLAKDMQRSDSSGLADPYGKVSFANRSKTTKVQKETISPIWNQTIVLSDVVLFGDPESAHKFIPSVTVEFFDKDWIGKDTYMGSIQIHPEVCLDGHCPEHPELQWLKIQRNGHPAGELLAAFILFLTDGVVLPEPRNPAPEMQKTVIDTLLWGVTLTKKYHDLIPINHVLTELDCAGATKRMKNPAQIVRKRLNFPQPGLSLTVCLPKNPCYASPLNIKLLDERLFGWTTVVGASAVPLGPYFSGGQDRLESLAKILEVKSRVEAVPTDTSKYLALAGHVRDEQFDWWSKFYASLQDPNLKQKEYDELQLDKLVVYDGPLEDYFSGSFEDVFTSYELYDGRPAGGLGKAREPVGTMKAIIGAYPALSDDGQPPVQSITERVMAMPPMECVVRVYVIRALNLMPRDRNGKSDPYIRIEFGGTVIKDDKSYIANELNPVFGKMYELKATLPSDSLLKVSVMDYDRTSADDLIGQTTIDLENRYLSKHRALCGLPETFTVHGCNSWRDNQSPVAILNECCVIWGLGEPVWDSDSEVKVGDDSYKLHTFEHQGGHSHANLGQERQRLALHILRAKGLVPEHVESRPLLSPTHDSEQGRLQMWVDMFPRHLGPLPSAVDITPRKPQNYVLRVVVYDAVDAGGSALYSCFDDNESDLYVKCWMQGEETPQKTDVHYRSVSGEGNFNWRFVFPFEYLPQEKVMVVKKKEHFYSLGETERRLPPRLTVQLWDSEFIGPNEYMGMIELDLLNMIPRSKYSRLSSLRQLRAPTINLFDYKKLRGWWPVTKQQDDRNVLAGKLDLELELLTEREAQERPAGKGRQEPNANPFLPEPKRPSTSFLWVTSPWKTAQVMVCRRFKQWVLCPFALCCLCCCFIFFFIIAVIAVGVGVSSAVD